MSTKLIPVEIEEGEDAGGGVHTAPAVRGGDMSRVEIVEEDFDSPLAAAAPPISHGAAQPPPPAQQGGYVMRGPMLFRPEVPPPVNMDRVVREAMGPPSPGREHVVEIVDDDGASAYDDVASSAGGEDVRRVQIDGGKRSSSKKKRGGIKKSVQIEDDPTKVVMDL
eukprot:jgi/Mesvir1/13546/Mv04533-RA.1